MTESGGAAGVKWSWDDADGPSAAPLASDAREVAWGNRFHVIEPLGRGAMGVVYRARELETGRVVALKVLRAGASENAERRLVREGRVTAALEHPNIVRIHSAGEIGGVAFLAYELIEGAQTFEDVLYDWDQPRLLRALVGIARGVGFAHAHEVLHRDLKPSNVLLDGEGRPKVADFGLGWITGATQITQTGALIGTPHYMPPERIGSERADHGPAGDVWSLGVILYQVLTGQLPFEHNAETLAQLAAHITTMPPARPRRVVKGIDRRLDAVCMRAMSIDPRKRYANGDAFADALEAALEPGTPTRTALPLALAFVAAVGLATWLIAGGEEPAPPTPPEDSVEQPAPVARLSPAEVLVQEGKLDAARELLAGEGELAVLLQRLAYAPETVDGAHVPAPLRRGVAAWLLREGRRELSVLRRLEDPRLWVSPDVEADALRARGRAALNLALRLQKSGPLVAQLRLTLAQLTEPSQRGPLLEPLLAEGGTAVRLLQAEDLLGREEPAEALRALESAGDTPAVAWRRGQALLRLRRFPHAARELRSAAEREVDDPRILVDLLAALKGARDPEADAVAARLGLLRGERREEASDMLLTLRRSRSVGSAVREGAEKILALDPLSFGAQYYYARGRIVEVEGASWDEVVSVVSRCPSLLTDLARLILGVQSAPIPFAHTIIPLAERAGREQAAPPLLRGLLYTWAAEHERADTTDRARSELEAALEADPGELIAIVLRAFLHVRSGQLLQAERDLDVAERLDPSSGLVAWYRTLLVGVRGGSVKEVQAALDVAAERSYQVWREPGWKLENYPELRKVRSGLKVPK